MGNHMSAHEKSEKIFRAIRKKSRKFETSFEIFRTSFFFSKKLKNSKKTPPIENSKIRKLSNCAFRTIRKFENFRIVQFETFEKFENFRIFEFEKFEKFENFRNPNFERFEKFENLARPRAGPCWAGPPAGPVLPQGVAIQGHH